VFVRSKETAVEVSQAFAKDRYDGSIALVSYSTQMSYRLCPIFQVSNVTGEGLDFVSAMS
jgi:GTPase